MSDHGNRNVGAAGNITGSFIITGDNNQITVLSTPPPLPPLYVGVPPLPQNFLGRDALINSLVKRLCSGESTALSADGLPGVGKTSLAVALTRHVKVLEHFSDGILWAGLGRRPNVAAIQANWAEHLGAEITDIIDPAERMARINAAIGQRKLLFILDDAWSDETGSDEVLEHLRATGPNVTQLLTTRDQAIARRFAGASGEISVPVLERLPSYALLARLAPEACAADSEAAEALADKVGGLPLALELLGGYLAEPARHLFPELSDAAFAELADPATRLQLAKVRLGSVTGERQSLAETINLSLEDLAETKANALPAFYALGAFAPKPATFDLAAAKAVTESDAATLALLIARSLLEKEDEELVIHQVISDVARQETPPEAIVRHGTHYLALVEEDPEDWQTIEAIYSQVSFAGYTAVDKVPFVDELSTFQQRRGLWDDRLVWLGQALAQARHENDLRGEARMLYEYGYVYSTLGEKGKALDFYEQALPLTRQVGEKGGEATTLNNMGHVHDALGEKGKALEFYEQALPLQRQVGDKGGEAATLTNMGRVHDDLGEKSRALDFYERALPLRRQVGNKRGEARTLTNIGTVHNALGEKGKALDFYEQALPLWRQVGNKGDEATTLNNMGLVYGGLGEKGKALEFYEQALPLRRQVGDKGGEATTLNNIGLVHDALGEKGMALDFYEQALSLWRQVGDKGGEATTVFDTLKSRQ